MKSAQVKPNLHLLSRYIVVIAVLHSLVMQELKNVEVKKELWAQTVRICYIYNSNPCFIRFRPPVLVQKMSPSLPSSGAQRTQWCQLCGSLTSVSLPRETVATIHQ